MRKLAILIPLLFACYSLAQTCNAASASSANVQTALTACAAGGTVNIPSGSATWTSEVSVTVTGPLTISGATVCTAGCAAGSSGVSLAFTDNTTITMSVAGNPSLNITGCSATNFCRITNLTIINTSGGGSAIVGAINLTGTHAQVSSRVDHLHVTNNSGTVLVKNGEYGLTDHILYNGSSDYTFATFTGDFASLGYLNWQDATNFGTNQAEIVEDSNFASGNAVMDGYFGCKATIRYSQITLLAGAGIDHGTDSGGYRSCVDVEIYNTVMTSVSSAQQNPFGIRGGVLLFHDNVMSGTFAWPALELDYYRIGNPTVAGGWGLANANANWTPTTVGAGSAVLNPQVSAWASSHAYAANALVLASGSNYLNLSGSCTSGGSTPNAAVGSNSSDGVCNWENVGGGVTAPPGSGGTNAGFLSSDNETTCSSGATCTRFLDALGGYPFRDQPGVIHGQVVYGNYQWNNSGSNQPASWWATDASSAVQLNRDYFNTSPGGYTPYTYPDPLQGIFPGSIVTGNVKMTANTVRQ